MRFNHYGVISEISDFPGCGQIGVSHYVFLPKGQRGKGIGKTAHKNRLDVLEHLGYDVALCTVDMDNSCERHILEINQWTFLTSFKSSKTGNTVGLYSRGINSKLLPIRVADKQPAEVYYEDYTYPDESMIGAYDE